MPVRPRPMRPRVLVLTSLLVALLGTLVSTLVVWAQPQCVEAAICRVDVSRGEGCLPGPCDGHNGLPVELWVGMTSGLLLGLVAAVIFEVRRSRRASGEG